MSGFFGSSEPARWGGFLKQAISNVETTFDSLLEQNASSTASMQNTGERSQTTSAQGQAIETETETYMDPISGMVTTIQRPKREQKSASFQTTKREAEAKAMRDQSLSERRSSSATDLSARLAAVMADKNRKRDASPSLASSQTAIAVSNQQKSSPDNVSDNGLKILPNTETSTSKQEDHSSKKETLASSETSDAKYDVADVKDVVPPVDKDKAEEASELEIVTSQSGTTDGGSGLQKDEANSQLEKIRKLVDSDHQDGLDKKEQISETTDSEQQKPVAGALIVPALEKSLPSDGNSILEQREAQLLQAMQTIAELHDQIHALQERLDKESAAYKDAQDKLYELQKQIDVSKESANLQLPTSDQKQIRKLENIVEDLKQQLSAKVEQIQGLMEEGEKLSKTELKQTTIIKKLRSEKQDLERTIAELQKKIEKSSSELVEANAKLIRVSESEKRLKESVKVLSDMTEKQTKHINKLETDIIALKERRDKAEASVKEALNNLEKEREKARIESQKDNLALLENEKTLNSKLREELAKAKEAASVLETRLRDEIRELQETLQASQMQAGKNEDDLRQEITELRKRLQGLESSKDDVFSKIEEATAPLLRQIEELQTQHSIAMKTRDQKEQNIIFRLKTAEIERDEAKKKAYDTSSELTSALERLEEANAALSREKRETLQLRSHLETNQSTMSELSDRVQRLQNELTECKANEATLEETIKLRYQKLMKERLLEEKRQWEIKHKSQQAIPSPNGAATPISTGLSNDNPEAKQSPRLPEEKVDSPGSSESASRSYVDLTAHSSRHSSITPDRLQTYVRQLENQLRFYQTQLQSTTQSRDELSEEIYRMNIEMERLRKEAKRAIELETKFRELEERYQASLELLGERTEQVEELKADIADVKEMYRNQIVDLIQKVEQHK